MSRLGAKTYSRKPECRTSIQFDHLLSDKGNKPSTAKVSVAGIHRWGMTSFTSIRKNRINGQKEIKENNESVKRPKLDTPSSLAVSEDPFSFESDLENPSLHSSRVQQTTVEKKPVVSKPNKFFKSGSSRALTTSSNSPKNSDFDALRLSVPPPTYKTNNDIFLNVHSNYKTNEVIQGSNEQSLFLSNTNPNIVYCSNVPSSCASTNYSSNPSVHYLNPYVQPVITADASSRAFDALISSKNTFPDSCLQFETNTDIIDNTFSQAEIDKITQEDPSILNFDAVGNHMHMQHISQSLDDKLSSQETCDSDDHQFSSCEIEKKDSNGHFSQELLNSETKCDYASSQEIVSSQSTDKSEENASFKQSSRPKKIFSSSMKFKAKYNHRHWQEEASKKETEDESVAAKPSLADEFEDDIDKEIFSDVLIEDVANTSYGEIRSVKCPKDSKQYYKIVKNVKQAYQCHESGETQEFNDDIEYLLECVQECNNIGTRCLSILNLAAKCMGPAFRIHLRAHGTMPKIFSALKDAPLDPNLALCTATLMFVLSQDRLTMDIEASTLSLMLQLLETDPELRNPEKEIDLILKDPALCAMQDRHREKVYQLCEEMQQKGHAKHLKLDNINTGILAMETLLSLTSRKAGEWFKEEMRLLHGLDHIADTVTSCVDLLLPEEREIVVHPTEIQLDRIRKIDRCLRVLENVTHLNSENQEYLMHYKNMSLIDSCLNLMKLCKSHLLEQKPIETDTTEEPTQKTNKSESPVLSCLLNVLKILSNITYNISLDDSRYYPNDGFMDNLLVCILQVPRAVPTEKRFDLLVLSLGLLINLVEYCDENSTKFIQMDAIGSFDTVNDGYEMPASETLVELMLSRLEAARVSEEQADELLNSQEEKQAASIEKKDIETAVEDLEETLMKTLQKAGKHMEHSIIAAYIAIFLGCVTQKNPDFIDILREQVPDGKFDVMVDVLKKFKSFVTLTGSVRSRELVFIQKVIQVLESS